MELFWTPNKWNYQITVKGRDNQENVVTKVYRTIDIIADRSSNLRGRATRVYEAYEVGNPGSIVVIKDSWLDVNRDKEGDTLQELLKDASDDEKAMFLTVLIHGVVEIDGKEDLTRDLLMKGYLVSTDPPKANNNTGNSNKVVVDALEKIMAKAVIDDGRVEDIKPGDLIYTATIFEILRPWKPAVSQPESLVTSPDVSSPSKTKDRPREYGPKAHYRIVFKERGQSLYSMSFLGQIKLPLVVQTMRDILQGRFYLLVLMNFPNTLLLALAFLSQKGYLHRDLSPGNIIFYEGRAKLSDLDFAKEFESGTSNHIRTVSHPPPPYI